MVWLVARGCGGVGERGMYYTEVELKISFGNCEERSLPKCLFNSLSSLFSNASISK